MKRKFILLTLVIATLIVPANLQAFESTVEEELQTPWEGFGYNQWGFARESDGNTFKPWSDDLWKTTTERILAIKPSLVRLLGIICPSELIIGIANTCRPISKLWTFIRNTILKL